MLRLTTSGLAFAPETRVLRAADYAAAADGAGLVEAAKAEAAALRAAAEADAARIRKEAEDEFVRRRAEGHAEGVEAGKAEISQQIVECMGQSAAYFSKVEGVMVDLVMRAVRRVFGNFEQREVVTDAVRHALQTTRNEGHVTVRVAPTHAEWVQSQIGHLLAAAPKVQFLEVLPDSRLPEDGCVLETEIGVVDASIQTQLRAIEKALISALK